MANANNWKQTSEQKPEFTDYTSAGITEKSLALRLSYEAARSNITLRRSLRLDNRFWDTRLKPHPVKVRCGYPKKRERNEDMPSKRGVPHSNFLKRFKLVYNRAETVCKIYVLHATRGWKLYA